jgi:hypothetical protein
MLPPPMPSKVDLGLRATLLYRLDDDRPWFRDKKRVGAIVDAILATDLADAISHAGVYGEEKAVRGAAAIRKAVITGTKDGVTLMDGPDQQTARMNIWLSLATDWCKLTATIYGPAFEARRDTLLDSIAAIGVAGAEALRGLGGLAEGWAAPSAPDFAYPRVRPPVWSRRYQTTAILELIDLAFHRGEHDAAREDSVRLGTAEVPAPARRSEHGDIVVVRWIDSLADPRAVAIAAGRHEQWMAGLIELDRDDAFSDEGDRRVSIGEPTRRAPFTTFDAEDGIGYKAIVVDRAGEPDDEVWDDMVAALAARKKGLTAIRLIAPLRAHAVALAARARDAGFDAVLYPGEDDQLWNPSGGWWADEEPALAAAKPAKPAKGGKPAKSAGPKHRP